MKELRSLASREGRRVLREIFRELRFDKQLGGFGTLSTMWRICTTERELFRYSNIEVTVLHPLGVLRGSSLWMQEVVNRFYYSTINSFVYFGAAMLLVMIGIRRFTDRVTDSTVLGSILFEAFLLVIMFVVMFFSPTDDSIDDDSASDEESSGDVLREIGEIGRDYADVSMHMEQAVSALRELSRENSELMSLLRQHTEAATQAVAPNPQLLQSMNHTAQSLDLLEKTVKSFNAAADKLQREEIESAVRREVERLLREKTKL